jgi:hypothetical protein
MVCAYFESFTAPQIYVRGQYFLCDSAVETASTQTKSAYAD